MPSDNISQIKERLNVVDVISGYIKVQKAGVNFKARCPFHNEKTPSFYISPERQIWHCFGCQKGGDIFSFVKEIEGIEFVEALRILAQRAGVKLEEYDPAIRNEKAVLYEICEASARFFEKQLHHSSIGKKAKQYLRDRGLNEKIIEEFHLGFAPEGWHNLSNFLRDCGYREQDIINSGLALKREDGSEIYDRFRSRVIFPITDINDQTVGFTGRIFEYEAEINDFPGHKKAADPGAKYINTPQTQIYDKSRILYGLSKAKTEARRSDRCLLVEGNMDAIMSYQAGVKNVVATSGTALTPSHLQLLQRYTNNLDFCFDTDQAGLNATRRGLGLALSQNFNVKIVHLSDPECKDPADYVKKFGPKWQEVVQASKPVIDFYFDKLKAEVDFSSVEGKKTAIASLSPLIKRLASKVERAHWVSRLAAVFRAKEEAVEADIVSAKDDLEVYVGDKPGNIQKEVIPENKLPNDMLLESLLAVVFKNPSLFSQEVNNVDPVLLSGEAGRILLKIKEIGLENFDFNKLIAGFDEEKKMKIEFARLRSQELLQDFSNKDLKDEFGRIRSTLERRSINVQLAAMELEIKAAESAKDKNKLDELLVKFTDLTKELNKNNA